ncbi:MAG: glycoside hydrolase 43 family protein [Bacteroidales bacterium]|nr:MAG: glycoside hydrolase 43 family protein [Bacteroidales bacterium]
MRLLIFLYSVLLSIVADVHAQDWIPDLGNGNYKNPVIFADYSDPDVIRVDDDFYMVASSFNCMPGLPVLHSRDLVNWKIIGHVYDKLPFDKFDEPSHGQGSWAPSIRYNNGLFYVYFCTPHEGLFMATTADPAGNWDLHHIVDVEMWEDPCPIWDDDGTAYLVRSKLRGAVLYLHRMSTDGRKLLDNGTVIFQNLKDQPTIEGPKFLKKDGYYYILAPAGGVSKGWQTVLRSKDIYGPYEDKIVLHTGNTSINGPHQGGILHLKSGEWWFVHFQSRGAYGRIIHLQPVEWKDNWPLIGIDINNDGIGEPVMEYSKPDVGQSYPVSAPQTSDEFNSNEPGLQWQWHANIKQEWFSLTENPGFIRLYAVQNISQNGNLWFVPNLMLQKFPAPSFTVTTKITFEPGEINDKAGMVIMGREWAYIAMEKTETGLQLGMFRGTYFEGYDKTENIESVSISDNTCYLRVSVTDQAGCHFSFSPDGKNYRSLGEEFTAKQGVWIGAKIGLFSINPNISESKGYADFDWFRF